MDLLPDGQKNTAAEVLWEDQQRINKFSTLILKKDDSQSLLETLRTEKEYLDDLALEVELLDEDEMVKYKIGEAFFHVKSQNAIAEIEAENERLAAKIAGEESSIAGFDTELNELKHLLYAKFGKNINLER